MSSLPNSTLVGSILPGGVGGSTQAGSIDTTQVIDEILPSLHASTRGDLAPEWSEGDLIEWMDEAVQRLAAIACVFVGRSTALLTAPATATYPLPSDHLSTLHVTYKTTSLRGASHLQLEGRDANYRTAEGTPLNWYEDLLGLATIALAPVPNDAQALPLVYQGLPPTLDAGKQNTLLAAPSPIKGYLAMAILAGAYGREGELEMPDIADHCRGRLKLYEQSLTSYYGKAL
jgi:hypothetical protein